MARKDQFITAFSERLLTYAVGRGVDENDMPAVRKIAASAAKDGYRVQSVIRAVVKSDPFMLKRTASK